MKKRTETFERDRKRLWTSTPSIAGHCRITLMYEASDKRRRYVPCPHCGAFQILTFDALKWDNDLWPHHAWFECVASGCVIGHEDKYPGSEAVDVSFLHNSRFVSEELWNEIVNACGPPMTKKKSLRPAFAGV